MQSVLTRLERRFGKFAIPNLTTFIVAGMAVTFVLGMVKPGVTTIMELDLAAVRAGQVWRLVSYLFLPRSTNLISFVLGLSFTLFIGRRLEAEWGAFKLNTYYLLGMLGTTVAAALSGASVGNYYLNASLVLAVATLLPDEEVWMIIAIPMKWVGLLTLALLAFRAIGGTWGDRAGIVAAMVNYLLFFNGRLIELVRAATRKASGGNGVSSTARTQAPEAELVRVCSACGAREADGADIRVCSCEKCGIPTLFCVEHARKH